VLADTLCTRCGLCCDGTLLGDVELAGPAEAARLELLGLDVDTDDADGDVLPLPCAALRSRCCRIYALRPQTCRTFECRLLKNAQRGAVTVDAALATIAHAHAQVARVTALLARMESRPGRVPLSERVADARAAAGGSSLAARATADLDAAMAALAATIRTTFLD
jgi:Fe-S-cluster containining protein